MKKLFKGLLAVLAMAVVISLAGTTGVQAKEIKYETVENSKAQFNADLDGDGTKEYIRIETFENTSYAGQIEKFRLFVNNEQVYEGKPEYAWGVDYGFVNINPKNASKQLIIRACGEDNDNCSYVFKYSKNKTILMFTTYYEILKSQSKNNKVRCIGTFSCRLGDPHFILNCKIQNKILIPVDTKVAKIANDGLGTQHVFIASKKIKVYGGQNTVNTKKVVKTMKSGEKFIITKVSGKFYKNGGFKAQYCLIATAKGETIGWINVKGTAWNDGQIVSNGLFYS